MRAIPYVGLAALARFARRTRLVRAFLAALLVALTLAAALTLRSPEARETFVPRGTSGIIVLDLSASISADTYSRIGSTLRELAASGSRFGLVLFSDVAYEALPPGTPAAELLPLARFFTLPKRDKPGFAPTFPHNPWSLAFSSGTRISAGLDLALSIATRGSHRSVLLVSDLADDANDISRLTATAVEFRRRAIPLRVIALNPNVDDQRLFERLLGSTSAIRQSRLSGEEAAPARTTGSRFPWLFVGLGLAVTLALAFHELWSARLTWRRPAAEASA